MLDVTIMQTHEFSRTLL